jgi:2-polyprenyl-3-methyl-5-hydroxy-6-metoxy-1,4-benzoquinol methylase
MTSKRSYHEKNIIPLISDKLNNANFVNILEIGPGNGELAEILLERSNIQYYAIDIDDAILKNINSKFPQISIFNCDTLEKIYRSFEHIKFDIILATDVWEHLPKSELYSYTLTICNLLKNNGVMVIQVPNWGCPFTPNTFYAGDLTHCNIFNEYSLRELFLKCGVESEDIELVPFYFPYGLVGFFRNVICGTVILFYKLILVIFGLLHLSICTSNIIIKIKRGIK